MKKEINAIVLTSDGDVVAVKIRMFMVGEFISLSATSDEVAMPRIDVRGRENIETVWDFTHAVEVAVGACNFDPKSTVFVQTMKAVRTLAWQMKSLK